MWDSDMCILSRADTRICEGAAGNLPDSASEAAAKEILSLARSCGEGDILLALISGGGSALLSCPVPEVTVGEKRKVSQFFSALTAIERNDQLVYCSMCR